MATSISKLFSGVKGPMAADPEDDSTGDDEGLASAEAILKAIKANDASQLDLALADHYRTCQESEAPDGSESDDQG